MMYVALLRRPVLLPAKAQRKEVKKDEPGLTRIVIPAKAGI